MSPIGCRSEVLPLSIWYLSMPAGCEVETKGVSSWMGGLGIETCGGKNTVPEVRPEYSGNI